MPMLNVASSITTGALIAFLYSRKACGQIEVCLLVACALNSFHDLLNVNMIATNVAVSICNDGSQDRRSSTKNFTEALE